MKQYETKLSEKEDAELDAEFEALERRIQNRKFIKANKKKLKYDWDKGRTLSEREEMIQFITIIAGCFIAGAIVMLLLYTLFHFALN